jgi:hypothetical protein
MRGAVFVLGPHVEHHHGAALGLGQQFPAAHRREFAGMRHQRAHRRLQGRQSRLGRGAQRHPQIRDLRVRQTVINVAAGTPRFQQPCGLERLEVRADELDRNVGIVRQLLHALLTLGQDLKQFQALGTGHGLAQARDLFVHPVFDLTGCRHIS